MAAARAAIDVLDPKELLRLIGDSMPAWRQANDHARLGWSLLYCAHGFAALSEDEFAARLLGAHSQRRNPDDEPLQARLADELADRLGH